MKDADMRAVILGKYYKLRKDEHYYKLTDDDLDGIEFTEYERIGGQLGEYGYLDWHNSIGGGHGQGRITARGVDIIEGTAHPLIGITMNDHSVSVHGSTNVQIGSGNTIKTSADIGRIEQAIDRLPITEHEKAETKSLLSRISGNASFASLVGAIATIFGGQAH